jgi:hypothetical protein
MVMKTSPKTTVALLAILALGGSTAGSLFAESLQTNQIGSIGTAGAFFPDREISVPVQQAVSNPVEGDSDFEPEVIALPIEINSVTSVPAVETQVRAITTPEVATQAVTPLPTPVPSISEIPVVITEPTPQPSPEVSASQIPEPEVASSEQITESE